MVETALVIVVLLLLIVGIVDLATFMREDDVLIEAARHGARNAAAYAGRAPAGAAALVPKTLNCNVTSAGDPAPGDIAEAAIWSTCDYLELAEILPLSDWDVSVRVESRCLDDAQPPAGAPGNMGIIGVLVQQTSTNDRCLFCWDLFMDSREGEAAFSTELKGVYGCP